MLFNSFEFIFLFLPISVAIFFVLGRLSRNWALRWVILISLLFYAWWRPVNVLIIAPSVMVNFVLARMLERLRRNRPSVSRSVLLAGIAFNVAFLAYFKYTNFVIGAANDLFGANFVLEQIILPLGISFITFQKIAFLIDVHAGRVESFRLQDYCLFVLFFPQLIAGPIVHYRELMPQFQRAPCTLNMENVSVGATLFVFGLFKKVFLADGIAPLVNSLFDEASGQPISLLPAWIAAFGFTLQIYFDFSGYTDMALGLARLFGVRLPPNFNSPLKSSSIIDFWLRWHMSLTRFLTAYIYNPLVLVITRRRLARGQPAFTANNATVGGFLVLLMFPTMLTMFISGVWHGAGYLFILWGMLHGVFLTLNHAWRLVGKNLWSNRAAYARFMQPTGFVLTLLCVICSMVLFRSPTMGTASSLYRGMLGVNGFAPGSFNIDSGSVLWILALAAIAFGCPNSLQLLDRYDPALGWKQRDSAEKGAARALAWKPSLAWAVALSIITTLAILYLGGPSEFLYWQF